MYNIIAPAFFQKKTCKLPGIGQLILVTLPAEIDFLNTQIKAPQQSIVFAPASKNENVFNEFSAISELMKKKLDEEGLVAILGIGTFSQDITGTIHFEPVDLDPLFSQPVTAIRVIRQDAQHNILVGDKNTNNMEMTEMLNEEHPAIPPDRWWIWALALAIVAIGLLLFYYYQNGWHFLGNSNPL